MISAPPVAPSSLFIAASVCRKGERELALTRLEYSISNVYPNPFTQRFTVDYSLATPSSVRFAIYNVHGQLITVVEDGVSKTTGNHRIIFDASKFNSGLYYIKIETSDYSIVKQVFRSK